MFTSPWSVNRVYTRDRICLTKGPIIDPFPLPPPLHFSRRPVNRKRRFDHVSTPEPFEVAIRGRFPEDVRGRSIFRFSYLFGPGWDNSNNLSIPIHWKILFCFFVKISDVFFYRSLLGKEKIFDFIAYPIAWKLIETLAQSLHDIREVTDWRSVIFTRTREYSFCETNLEIFKYKLIF